MRNDPDIDFPDDLAVRVRDMGKTYRLGVINRRTLRDELSYRWMRFRRRDPRDAMGRVGGRESPGSALFHALDGVSFDIRKGETVGLVGRNGAGKSTMLKILARITEPSEGDAWIRGRVGSMLEVGTGFHPELTGRENIYLNGTILGMSKREIDAKFDEIVDFSEIGAFLDTPVKRYSSGMYVKLAFSIASSLDTDVLLLDEVLAVGDAAFRKKSLARMKEIAASGRTILFVSHSIGQIREICTRCLWFDHGRLRMDGTTRDVTSEYGRTAEAVRTGSGPDAGIPDDGVRLTRVSPRFNTARKGWDVRFDWDTGDGSEWRSPRLCAWLRAWSHEDVRIAAFDTSARPSLPPALPPRGSLVLEIPDDVRLQPGVYHVDCRLEGKGRPAADRPGAGHFEVRSSTPPFLWRRMPLLPTPLTLRHEWIVGPGTDDPEALPPDSVLAGD